MGNDIDEAFLHELEELLLTISPENTVEKLSTEKQAALASFFRMIAERITTDEDASEEERTVTVAGQVAMAFCAGHNWVAGHWALWE